MGALELDSMLWRVIN